MSFQDFLGLPGFSPFIWKPCQCLSRYLAVVRSMYVTQPLQSSVFLRMTSIVAIPVLHRLVADSSATCSKPMHSFRIDQNFIFSLIPSDYVFLSCPLFSEFFDLCRCAAFLSSYCLSSLHSTWPNWQNRLFLIIKLMSCVNSSACQISDSKVHCCYHI